MRPSPRKLHLVSAAPPELMALVERVRALPYGRPSAPIVDCMLREQRGTCSTKHLYLARELERRFADCAPQIVHRVYRVERAETARRFGEAVAATVPLEGLFDVHRYLTIVVGGVRLVVDATFAGPPWDGRSSMALACGDGEDHGAGADPDADKRALQALHCDPLVREPFIAALAAAAAAR